MRFGLCADIRNVSEVQEVGFDFIDGKLNQIALWSEEEFNTVLALMDNTVLALMDKASIKMERCALLFPKTMAVIGDRYNETEMRAYLETAFSRMDALGCDLVVFGSGKSRFVPDGMRWQDAYLQLVDVTRIVGQMAAEHGIRIAIEPLNRAETNLINSLAEGGALQADVNLSNVGLLADAYHMWQEGEDMNRILTCGPFMHTHIALKGSRFYPTEKTDEVREFFRLLKESGYDGTLSIEGKSDDWKADSIRALAVMRELAQEEK